MTGNSTRSDLRTLEQAFENSAVREPVTVTANTVADAETDAVTDRQERIDGFDQDTFSESRVLLVGAGGLGSQIARGVVRKGVGELVVCDEDHVAVSNLSRQLFYESDVGRNKAVALAENLRDEGTTGTEITGIPLHFQDAVARGREFAGVDIAVVAPDNDDARLSVAEYFLDQCPVVVTGLGQEAVHGYVFVQEPESACFRCFRGDHIGGGEPCSPTPSVLDPAMTMSGIVLYSIDSVLMDRYREWSVYEIFLSGVPGPTARTVERDADCPLCGETATVTGGEQG